jgi:serine/threonine-protein kinase
MHDEHEMGRMTRRLGYALAASIAMVAFAPVAAASDPATATMLFNEGRRLAAQHKFAEACPKFEESQRLDPGIGTQFNLADCYEHTQRTASAWALYLDVASTAGGTGQEARETAARRRAAVLEPKLSKLVIVAPKGTGDLRVRRNGELVDGVLWNTAVPVDPGSYIIEASATGKKAWSTIAKVAAGTATVSVTIPTLEADPNAAPSPAPTARAANADATPPPQGAPTPDDAAQRARTETIAAIALGGAGVVGIGLGAFFGFRSIAKHSDYEALCAGAVCQPAAGPLHDDAVSAGNVSTVAFVLGGALIGGGALLWFLESKDTASNTALQVGPQVGRSSAGVVLSGGW